MRIFDRTSTEDPENIVYKRGLRPPTEGGENVDESFDELKKKLVGER